jgi:alanine dehydrogenase
MTVHHDAATIRRVLPMRAAIDALGTALAAAPFAAAPQRLHLEDGRGATFLAMPVMADGWAGAKLVTIVPDNPARGLPLISATYTLFGPPGLEPVATIDGRALTDLRTGAVSGLATRHLMRDDARRLVILGAGAQGRSHVLAMAAVAELEDIAVIAPRPASVDALAAHVRDHGIAVPVRVGSHADLARADLVCACTTSATPVVGRDDLAAGVHVNAVGAYRPDLAEVAVEAVAACRVVVETREAALTEKGDLLQAEAAGAWSRDDIAADLHELVSGRVAVRTSASERTLFASVGHAYEDLVVARAIHEAA